MVAVVLIVFAAFMHLFAWSWSRRYAATGIDARQSDAGRRSPAALLLSFSLMLSQAMESVTRAFYARSDLELILSSPVDARQVFAVRIGAGVAAALSALAVLWRRPSSTCWR